MLHSIFNRFQLDSHLFITCTNENKVENFHWIRKSHVVNLYIINKLKCSTLNWIERGMALFAFFFRHHFYVLQHKFTLVFCALSAICYFVGFCFMFFFLVWMSSFVYPYQDMTCYLQTWRQICIFVMIYDFNFLHSRKKTNYQFVFRLCSRLCICVYTDESRQSKRWRNIFCMLFYALIKNVSTKSKTCTKTSSKYEE